MVEFLTRLFSPIGFMPRAQCGMSWSLALILLHTISDGLIWLSYMLIPLVTLRAYRMWRCGRLELQPIASVMPRLVCLYAAFIFSCGLTHFDNILVFWLPYYRLFGLVSLLTGLFSFATALSLAWIVTIATHPAIVLPANVSRVTTNNDDAAKD